MANATIDCITHPGDPTPEDTQSTPVEGVRQPDRELADGARPPHSAPATLQDSGISRTAHATVPPTDPTLAAATTEDLHRELLRRLGEDPSRDGLLGTPARISKSMAHLTRGYTQTVDQVLHGALFDVDYDEMVIVKDIEFYSLCEHHLLPFFGRAHIAYIPQGKVVGLSKVARLVDLFARRLQVQERLTRQIADSLIDAIHPQGAAVILEAQHLCMMMRGVEKQSSVTTTSAMLGVFKTQLQTRNEFLSLIRNRTSTL